MTRDMELIRKIIAEIQSWKSPELRMLKIDGYDPNVVGRHVEMLIEAAYAVGNVHRSSMDTKLTPFVSDLTYAGHDFAAAIENEGIWAKIKEALSPNELATIPLAIIKEVGFRMLQIYVMQKTGLE